MELIIRRASPGDAESIASVYLRARRAAAAAGSIPASVHSDEQTRCWIAQIVIPELECWLAVRDPNAVVGLLVLDGSWVDQLYVDPLETRAGIGAELVAVAKRERPDGLRLWTFVSNDGAQRFYRRHGFAEAKRTDGSDNEERAPDIQYVWAPGAPVSG